jgi:hypothetical protein
MARRNFVMVAVAVVALAVPFGVSAQMTPVAPSIEQFPPPRPMQSPPRAMQSPPRSYAVRLAGPDTDGSGDTPGQAAALGELSVASDGQTVTGSLSVSLEDNSTTQEACTVSVTSASRIAVRSDGTGTLSLKLKDTSSTEETLDFNLVEEGYLGRRVILLEADNSVTGDELCGEPIDSLLMSGEARAQ